MKLKEKIIAITGASRGIGRALALGFAREGARLILCSRDKKVLDDLCQEIAALSPYKNEGVFGQPCDISKMAKVEKWVTSALTRFPRIDVLINNAGVLGVRAPIVEYPEAQWRDTMDVNVNGVFYASRTVLNKGMLKERSGTIINISSGVGRVGKPHWGAYAVSKFAVEGLTQVLAAEVKDYGIRVFAFNPEPTRTIMRAAAYPQEDPMTLKRPEALVPALCRLILETKIEESGRSFSYKELA